MAKRKYTKSKTPEERFWAKVNKTDSCWLWTGAIASNRGGYGLFWDGERLARAHRFSYEKLVGEIPDNKEIHHKCRVTSCVNPEHLEAASKTNNLRFVWERNRALNVCHVCRRPLPQQKKARKGA